MFKSLLKQLFLLLTLLVSVNTFSQPAMMRTSFNGTYSPLSVDSGASVSTAVGDNAFEDLIQIGFTFNYLGNNYTTIGVNTNGIAAFTGISASANNQELYTANGPGTVLAPWWDDLNVASGTGSILYQLQGPSGSRTFTIQWTDVTSFRVGATALLNFQVTLYEQDNKIEFRYGAAPTGIFNAGSESACVGIKTSAGGNGEFIDAVTGSSYTGNGMLCADNMWPSRFYRFIPGTSSPVAAGTYTAGLGGNYPNISEAIADLNHRGVAGNGTVNIVLIDSIYDATPAHGNNFFPLLLGPIQGASIMGSISIAPLAGVARITSPGHQAGNCVNQVSLSAIDTNNEPVIGFVGMQFGSLTDLLFTTSSSFTDRGILFINSSGITGTRNCGLLRVAVVLDRTNPFTIGFDQHIVGTPLSAAGANSFNICGNLQVTNSNAGISLMGNPLFPDSSCTIQNSAIGGTPLNDIGNGSVASYGIYANHQNGIGIIDNVVKNINVNAAVSCNGIFVESASGICNVYGNKIHHLINHSATATDNITGINAEISASGTHTMYVYNNFVYDLNSAYSGPASGIIQERGIHIQPAGGGAVASEINVDFNTVYIHPSSITVSNTCFETGTATGPQINTRNNIFSNGTASQSAPAAHFCWISPSANSTGSGASVSDYNNFYVVNATRGFVGRGNTTNYSSLANWQAAMTQDATSLTVDPMFSSATNMHINNVLLHGAGTTISWIPVDIDNEVRAVIPDIGADEMFRPDASPTTLVSPESGNCYNATETVIVRVMNAGTTPLDFTVDSVLVTVNISGAITQTLTVMLNDNSLYNGDPLPLLAYVDVSMGTINMSNSGSYIFDIHTSLTSDGNPGNDTLGTIIISAMSPVVSISGDSLICPSQSTLLTAIASNGDGNYSYQWSSGLGTNSFATVNPSVNTMYYVSITDGCGAFANDSIYVMMDSIATAGFNYSVNNNVVTFTNTSASAGSYSWNFGDTQTSTQQDPVHTYTANGTYTVILTSANGCGNDTVMAVITILTTTINEFIIGDGITAFPNPAREQFTVYFEQAENVVLELFDADGKLLQTKEQGNTMKGMSFVMDIRGYENGIYFLRVSSDQSVQRIKIIVQE